MKNQNLLLHTLAGLVWIVGLVLLVANLTNSTQLVGLGVVLLMTGTLGKLVATVTRDDECMFTTTGSESSVTKTSGPSSKAA